VVLEGKGPYTFLAGHSASMFIFGPWPLSRNRSSARNHRPHFGGSIAQVAGAVMKHHHDDVRLDAVRVGMPTLLHLQQQSQPLTFTPAGFLVMVRVCSSAAAFKFIPRPGRGAVILNVAHSGNQRPSAPAMFPRATGRELSNRIDTLSEERRSKIWNCPYNYGQFHPSALQKTHSTGPPTASEGRL
jgi:hypothetical protein